MPNNSNWAAAQGVDMDHQQKKQLNVVVHFVAVEQAFKGDRDPQETVRALKAVVLDFFGVKEGQSADGNSYVFTLFHDRTPLEDPLQQLDALAGDKHVLQLKLAQQVTQG